jgi:hypothetical protein
MKGKALINNHRGVTTGGTTGEGLESPAWPSAAAQVVEGAKGAYAETAADGVRVSHKQADTAAWGGEEKRHKNTFMTGVPVQTQQQQQEQFSDGSRGHVVAKEESDCGGIHWSVRAR